MNKCSKLSVLKTKETQQQTGGALNHNEIHNE